MLRVLNLGAGVQSTTLYLMACDPQDSFAIDCAIFADTGDEPRKVYEHLQWMLGLGGPPILVRSKGRLGDHLMRGMNSTGQRFASIPAYTKKEGSTKEGQVRRQCTKEYKVDVVERTIRRDLFGMAPGQQMPRKVVCVQILGLSADEPGRAFRVTKNWSAKWSRPEFPLLGMGWDRKRCREYLATRVPHRVPRSACVFCPYRTSDEWADMKNDSPEDFARAVEIDEALRIPGNVVNRGMEAAMYLHRSCIPLQLIDFTTPEPATLNPLGQECLGMCGN